MTVIVTWPFMSGQGQERSGKGHEQLGTNGQNGHEWMYGHGNLHKTKD
jgi:hypothetical protein